MRCSSLGDAGPAALCRGSRKDQKKNPALKARGISFFRADDLVGYLVPGRHHIPIPAGVKGFVVVHCRAAADRDGVGNKGSKRACRPAESKRGIGRVYRADECLTAATKLFGAGIQTVNAKVARLLGPIDHATSGDVEFGSHIDLHAGSRGKVNKAAAARFAGLRHVKNSVTGNDRRVGELERSRIIIVSITELPAVISAADGIASMDGSES